MKSVFDLLKCYSAMFDFSMECVFSQNDVNVSDLTRFTTFLSSIYTPMYLN